MQFSNSYLPHRLYSVGQEEMHVHVQCTGAMLGGGGYPITPEAGRDVCTCIYNLASNIFNMNAKPGRNRRHLIG